MKLERVGVVGGGLMGSGIAALFASQRIPVTLFDVREDLARASVEKMARAEKLPELTTPSKARYITPASVDAYAELLPACDLIVEVVPEILSLKQKVLAAIDAHRKPGSLVATNTSGLSIASITAGCSADLRAHFLGAHFFYPVRYMALVELIPSPDTAPGLIEATGALLRRAGKRPLLGRDTPNFIANRIGVHALTKTMALAAQLGLSVEEVDLVTGPPLANPKSATFRLADLVGLDTLLHVTQNSFDGCPADEAREDLRPPEVLRRLVEQKRFGQKTGEGFYKKAGKDILALDLKTLEYVPLQKPRLELVGKTKRQLDPRERIRTMVAGDGPAGALARGLVLASGAYALNRLGEVAGDLWTIDKAMEWGFGRELGPVEALEAIGLERAASLMEAEGIPVPAPLRRALDTTGSFYGFAPDGRVSVFSPASGALEAVPADPRALDLARVRRAGGTVREWDSARLVDLGDGVLLCEPASRYLPGMNPIDDQLLAALGQAHDECAAGRFRALVIGNQAANLCAGANLKAVLELAVAGKLDAIDAMAKALQDLCLRGLHAHAPVVAAPHGMTLGGGLELSLGAQVRVALSELYCGLVEVGVGLVPAGGGCLRLLQLQAARKNLRGRPFGPMQQALAAFDLIGYGKVSSSAEDALQKGLLAKHDEIVFSKDEQLQRAKEVALARLEGFQPLPAQPVALAGRSGYLVMEDTIAGLERLGKITPHAGRIARVQARILTGGADGSPVAPTSEERLCELEREGFLELVAEPATQARMKHMLETGKPLFN